MKLIGLLFGAVLAAQPFSVSVSHAQTVTRPGLAPGSSWSFTRSPTGVTVSREGTTSASAVRSGQGTTPLRLPLRPQPILTLPMHLPRAARAW